VLHRFFDSSILSQLTEITQFIFGQPLKPEPDI
jgi:hypothetical protein